MLCDANRLFEIDVNLADSGMVSSSAVYISVLRDARAKISFDLEREANRVLIMLKEKADGSSGGEI